MMPERVNTYQKRKNYTAKFNSKIQVDIYYCVILPLYLYVDIMHL